MNLFRNISSIKVVLLLSYLTLVSVTALHHHELHFDADSKIEFSDHTKNDSDSCHDHCKCLITNFSTLKILDYKNVEKSNIVTDEELILKLENYSIEKTFAFNSKLLRAPPIFNS